MRIKNWTIGTDPELFLEKDGKIISAEGLIGGTKNEPKPISDKGHFIQEDNVMVEFNIPPCNNAKDFVDNINFVREHLETLASLKGMKLNYTTSNKFDKKTLSTPQASQFGCEPSYNVYLKDISPTPNSKSLWRGCGGHLHIGWDKPTQENTERVIYVMDMILGLNSIILDPDTMRRKNYGKAGEFRFKSFGCEYRTLSNFWIKNDKLINWVYESTSLVIDIVNSDIVDNLIEKYSNTVREAINNSDKNLAKNTLNLILKEFEESKINKKELVIN